jgi:hypothetical protein
MSPVQLWNKLSGTVKFFHDKIRDKKCVQCEYATSDKGGLTRLFMIKIRDKKCPFCYYASSQAAHISLHIKAVHDKTQDKQCPHCDFKSSYANSLSKHITFHTF